MISIDALESIRRDLDSQSWIAENYKVKAVIEDCRDRLGAIIRQEQEEMYRLRNWAEVTRDVDTIADSKQHLEG